MEVGLLHDLTLQTTRVHDLQHQLQQTIAETIVNNHERKKGLVTHCLCSNRNRNPNPWPLTLTRIPETRQHDVDSHRLFMEAEQAVIQRAIMSKKARRTEACLIQALTVEQDRVNVLQQSLDSTLAENLVIIQARKKCTLYLMLCRNPYPWVIT